MPVRSHTALGASVLIASMIAAPVLDARSQTTTGSHLASGPYATMYAKLEVTLFDIDVLELAIRFDEPTRRELERIARGRGFSDERAVAVARAALEAQHALVRVTFLRDVTTDQYLEGVERDLRRAFEAGLIDERSHHRIRSDLPRAFGGVGERGFRKGDELYYRIRPGAVRSVIMAEDGRVIAERVERGAEFPRAVLGSYFAPGSTFRDLLIRSLFR